MKNTENYIRRGVARQHCQDFDVIEHEKKLEKLIVEIRRKKDALNMTYKELATKSGLNISTVNNLVHSKMTKWSEHHFEAFEKALGIQINRTTLDVT